MSKKQREKGEKTKSKTSQERTHGERRGEEIIRLEER